MPGRVRCVRAVIAPEKVSTEQRDLDFTASFGVDMYIAKEALNES
ncbi:MAG: hypothetical protein ACPGUC_00790 [Gammaproteobacteria bacterium]